MKASIPTARAGEGVYRLSFWKTWEDVLLNVWQNESGSAIQRVREDHPSLSRFLRDHDEYLVHHAWLYWNVFPIADAHPDWSYAGVPHTDIEVLHPDGRWLPMDEIPCISDHPLPGWTRYALHTFAPDPSPLFVQRTAISRDGALVLIRQPSGPWATFLSSTSALAPLLADFAQEIDVPLEGIRWFYALESDDAVHAQEITASFRKHREPGLRGHVHRFMGVHPTQRWFAYAEDDGRYLSEADLDRLYAAFDASEVLRRGKRWSYGHRLPAPGEMERIRARRAGLQERSENL